MLKKLVIGAALALTPVAALASGAEQHIESFDFSFKGAFGTYDQNQLQRGLQIYTEVCSACHGLKFVPLRTLGDAGGPGLPADQVRAYAAENFTVYDADLDEDVPAKPVDHFPANTAAGAPDLSLMAKARKGGPDYIASLLNGYTGEEKEEAGNTFYENTAFPGGWISMAPPLEDEYVEFIDGHDNDLHHLSQDIAAYLMWTAEPKMMARKQAGFIGVLMLTILSVLLYLTNKRIWAPIKGKKTS
ncbi:MAG: cytochrome c1 [Rhodobacteraceae bacterium]|nr:MAG: cytochrome c1 [Paracoccaceae bacterium]